MRVYSVNRIREFDRITIDEFGLPSHSLMEVAGHNLYREICKRFEDINSVFVLCGKGNNGGDGLVVGRLFLLRGCSVSILFAEDISLSTPDLKRNFEILQKVSSRFPNLRIYRYGSDDSRTIERDLFSSDIIIDALLGTGINSNLKSPYREIVGWINSLGLSKKVVAIDIPSGLNGDTGSPMPEAIISSLTLTLGGGKIGLYSYPAPEYTGEVVVVDIGLPLRLDEKPIYEVTDIQMFSGRLKRRDINFHKGNGGHTGVVAGSPDRSGAAYLSVLGALRSGAGLVTLISEREVIDGLTTIYPEAMVRELDYSNTDERYIESLFSGIDTLVIGPGLGREESKKEWVRKLIYEWKGYLVLDAEALNLISGRQFSNDRVVITPHPLELSRIMNGVSKDEIQRDRIGYAVKTAKELNCTVVLKGARSVIANQKGDVTINTTGNQFMASGGMGDLLSGIIGGLLYQTGSPYEAARIGVFVHGLAADIKREEIESPLLATDVAEYLPLAFKRAGLYV
jgi:NAD(P)H-hydrate epimerase